jgi:hypothetical protein
LKAFARTGPDKLAEVSNAVILGNFRAAIRANEIFLRRIAIDRQVDSGRIKKRPLSGPPQRSELFAHLRFLFMSCAISR